MGLYFLPDDYQHNLTPQFFDDVEHGGPEWQREVYAKARDLRQPEWLVLDFGCGRADKLIEFFPAPTLGVDLGPTVDWLKDNRPTRDWLASWEPKYCDLLIAADVIEHLANPDWLLEYIALCNPRVAVISTPAREYLPPEAQRRPTGPHHAREWTSEEFKKYIGSRFKIMEHYISNFKQATQLMVLREPGCGL